MKVLAVVDACPYDKDQGARIRARKTIQALERFSDVEVVLLSRFHPTERAISELSQRHNLVLHTNTQRDYLTLKDRLSHELNPNCTKTHRCRISEDESKKITGLIKRNDLVWFHTVVPANCINYQNSHPAVLDIDDLLSSYYKSRIPSAKLHNKIRFFRMAKLWQRREQTYLNRFNSLGVCSQLDKSQLGDSDKITVIPNGSEIPSREIDRSKRNQPTIGFIGNLKYSPNKDGLDWFLKNVWPEVKKRQPEASFRVCGANSESLKNGDYPGVEYLGWIEDTEAEMESWWLSIVPILSGSGTRLKIASAFSMKCPVVSTSLGAYGYPAKGNAMIIADKANEFAQGCLSLIESESLSSQLGEKAYQTFKANYSWESIFPRFEEAAMKALSQE